MTGVAAHACALVVFLATIPVAWVLGMAARRLKIRWTLPVIGWLTVNLSIFNLDNRSEDYWWGSLGLAFWVIWLLISSLPRALRFRETPYVTWTGDRAWALGLSVFLYHVWWLTDGFGIGPSFREIFEVSVLFSTTVCVCSVYWWARPYVQLRRLRSAFPATEPRSRSDLIRLMPPGRPMDPRLYEFWRSQLDIGKSVADVARHDTAVVSEEAAATGLQQPDGLAAIRPLLFGPADDPMLHQPYEQRRSYWKTLKSLADENDGSVAVVEMLEWYRRTWELTEPSESGQQHRLHAGDAIVLYAELFWLRAIGHMRIAKDRLADTAVMLRLVPEHMAETERLVAACAAHNVSERERALKGKWLGGFADRLQFLVRRSRYIHELGLPRKRVAIVAAMSAGKSTLLNALLGCGRLPAKNEACTAKITTVHHLDGLTRIVGVADSEQPGATVSADVDGQTLRIWNEDERVRHIELAGKLVGIRNGGWRLAICDTPGMNSSIHRTHLERTVHFLESEGADILLFLFNATQLGADDNRAALRMALDAVQSGKNGPARIIFLLNQADLFDPERDDDLGESIRRLAADLREHGIEDAEIIPVSAYAAKLFRMALSGEPLTRKESADFRSMFELFTDERNGLDLNFFANVRNRHSNASDKPREDVSTAYEVETVRVGNESYDADKIREVVERTGIPLLERLLQSELLSAVK